MNVIEVSSTQGTTCASCAAQIAADQRYCLACGQPCSPVRLAFLDVLRAESELAPVAPRITQAPAGYLPFGEPKGHLASLLRYSGLFSLMSALLLTGLIGLLIGHWASASKAPTQTTIKLDGSGFGALAPAASTTTAPPSAANAAETAAGSATATKSKQAEAKGEEKESAQEAKETKAPPPVAHKISSNTLQKLNSSTGKKHEEEVNKLTQGDQPLETG
jgi:hypothetical protein